MDVLIPLLLVSVFIIVPLIGLALSFRWLLRRIKAHKSQVDSSPSRTLLIAPSVFVVLLLAWFIGLSFLTNWVYQYNIKKKAGSDILVGSPGPLPNGSPASKPDIKAESPKSGTKAPSSDFFEPLLDYVVGRIVYNVPDTMKYRKPSLVTAYLSPEEIDSLLTPFQALPGAKSSDLAIGPEMKMTLREYLPDDSAKFHIKASRSEEQIIDSRSFTEWQWSVTPMLPGNNGLELVASIIVNRNGRNISKDITVFQDVVFVETPPPPPTPKPTPLTQIVAKNVDSNWEKYKWLWSTLLLPLSGWLAKKWAEWYKSRKVKPAVQEGIGFKPKAKENA